VYGAGTIQYDAMRGGTMLARVFGAWEDRCAVLRPLGKDGRVRRHERRKSRVGGECSDETKLASRVRWRSYALF